MSPGESKLERLRASRFLVAALAVLVPLAARAEPKDDARRAFVSGLESAREGDYRTALDRFLEAQALYPHPATAFNIARAYEDLGDPAEALSWYRRFTELAPERAEEARPAIERLEQETAAPPRVAAVGLPSQVQATPAELDRLRSLAAELEALATRLSTTSVVPAAPPADGVEPSSPGELPSSSEPAQPTDTPAAPSTGDDFLTEAYERVVVTASRYGQDPLDSPSTIAVITGDEIRLSGAADISEVLRRVAGVDVMSLSSATPSVGIRGFNSELSNKVLWLVDGRSVYWDFLAAPLPINIPVALEEIERIEIIRGPGSAIYGANAMTGVINIITRAPGDGPRALVKLSAGHPDFIQATALASGRVKRLGYRFSAGYDQQGRWAREPGYVDGGPLEPVLEDQDLGGRRVRAHGRLDQTFLDKGFASVSGGYTQGFAEFYNIGALGNYALQAQSHYVRTDVSYGPVHFRAFWNADDGRTGPWLSATGSPRDLNSRIRNDVVDAELEGKLRFTTGEVSHQINLGAGYRYKRVAFGYLQGGFGQPWVEHHAKAFVQEQLSWRWFGAVAALRLDRHPLLPISQTISPRGAFIFRVAPRTSVRVSGGTAYRAMNAVESYMDFALDTSADGFYIRDLGGAVRTPGEQQLSPERIVTLEVGAHDESSVWYTGDVAVYWNRVTDLIGLADVTPSIGPYDPANNGFQAGTTGWENLTGIRYDAIGGELDLRFFPANGLDVFTNLSLQRILETSDGTTVVDGSTSLAKLNFGALYRAPFRMDFTLMGHYTSKQAWRLREFDTAGQLVPDTVEIPGRFLLSARIAGRPFVKPDLELALTLWNPLGFADGFQEHPKGQPVGGRLFGSVTVGF